MGIPSILARYDNPYDVTIMMFSESFPCGPIAFWAFRDHIDNRNTLVVAKHADVGLQDELGCTMLHKAVQKKQPQNQADIIQVRLCTHSSPWWRHQMETFSAYLALCVGNSPVPVNYPHKGPVTRSFDDFFDLRLNKRLSKQPWG